MIPATAIRKAVITDLDYIYDLYMHPAINPFLLYEVMDKEIFTPIFIQLLQDAVQYIYSDNDKDVGMFKLIPHTYRSAHTVYLGGIAVHPQFAGMGYGRSMLNAIKVFTKQAGFLRIELSVAAQNEKAINLYKKTGFLKEGILKKYTYLKKEDRYLDEIMMAYLNE